MGRLFWKFFLSIWLTSILTGLTIGLGWWLLQLFVPMLGQQLPNDRPPPLLLPILAGALISLIFGALLARHITRPIHLLSRAFHDAAEGHLETRISPAMGHRSDEIAALGKDFDRMAAQLQQLIGAQQRLLHDVSHELRSPLARLQAAIGLARQNPLRGEAMLERIERETERLDTLVGELLTLARLESGAALSRERVDLVDLLAAIADDAKFEAQANGREVCFTAEGHFIAEVGAELIYRAFENVIRNAVKYTAPGSTVRIDAGISADGQNFEVRVADRGPEVPPEELERIFGAFYRGSGAPQTPGFGLGLAIARRAIESHGGAITAAAREGGGLEFRIRLPAQSPLSAP